MSKPRKPKEAFKNVNSIDRFIEIIKNNDDNLKFLIDNYFNDDTLETAILSLSRIKSNPDKTKQFLNFMHYVDSKLNIAGQYNQKKIKKIPTIYAGAIYIDKFEKIFNKYTMEQKLLIARYSIVEFLEFYKDINNLFSRRIMDCIVSKHKKWSYQTEFMRIAKKYKKTKTEDEVIEYIESKEPDELLRESYSDYLELVKKLGELDESRRF